MEAFFYQESGDISVQQNVHTYVSDRQYHITEDSNFSIYLCENFKSQVSALVLAIIPLSC